VRKSLAKEKGQTNAPSSKTGSRKKRERMSAWDGFSGNPTSHLSEEEVNRGWVRARQLKMAKKKRIEDAGGLAETQRQGQEGRADLPGSGA